MTFPINLSKLPDGFEPLASEPEFNPAKHLALETPTDIYSLSDLGYSEEEAADCPSQFAASSVFRILSTEGAECLYAVCKQLEAFTKSNPRIERCTRGGVYRSKFLRDLCLNTDVTEFLSNLAGIDLMPHTIPHQLGHLNYNPAKIGSDVDKWHVDTLRFDYVLFVTDPKSVEGGAFQYFKGTKSEIAALKASGKTVPADRVIAPEMPAAGYGIFQQGNMVVHQAKGLTAPGERITMVNGYVAADPAYTDYTRYDQLLVVDPPNAVTAEFAHHSALQAVRSVDAAVQSPQFVADTEHYAAHLEKIANELLGAAQQIRDTKDTEIEHFGT